MMIKFLEMDALILTCELELESEVNGNVNV